jgi:hypothetical protein
VTVNIDALHDNATQISIPSVATLMLSRRNEEVRSPTDFTWYGTVSGGPGQAILVVHDGNITGIIQDERAVYKIDPIGNGVHALIKVDQARFPPDDPPVERRSDISPTELREATSTKEATSTNIVRIDVMVPYTTAAKNAVGDIAATIRLAVDQANQSYQNSDLFIKLNLVDSFEISLSESGKNAATILADFKAMRAVQVYRDWAAVSVLIARFDGPCGRADAILATAATAFAVVDTECAADNATFAHEIGHLMGAMHDQANDPGTKPFAYGHGYQHPSSSDEPQSFRTIMAYSCADANPCNPKIPYWSSPILSYSGIHIGTAATNDNRRVLNETALSVSGFARPPSGEMVRNNSGLNMSVWAVGGEIDGSLLYLHEACSWDDDRCRWRFWHGMIVNDRYPSLAWFRGANPSSYLELTNACNPGKPDCTWTYRDGMFISNKDPSLAIMRQGTSIALILSNGCNKDIPECTWNGCVGSPACRPGGGPSGLPTELEWLLALPPYK